MGGLRQNHRNPYMYYSRPHYPCDVSASRVAESATLFLIALLLLLTVGRQGLRQCVTTQTRLPDNKSEGTAEG